MNYLNFTYGSGIIGITLQKERIFVLAQGILEYFQF